MRIGIVGSMLSTEKMIWARDKLIAMGHDAFVTSLANPFVGKSNEEKEKIKLDQKMNSDAIREFWRLMQGGDAILVMNTGNHGIKNYIGGNTFLEMGFAHVLSQKIFLFNPLPEEHVLEMFYKSEIEAMGPIIIYRYLERIK